MPPIRYKCINRIPYARGMGSSSAAIIAGLIGGLVLAGHKLPMWGYEELLQLACEIEVGARGVAAALVAVVDLLYKRIMTVRVLLYECWCTAAIVFCCGRVVTSRVV